MHPILLHWGEAIVTTYSFLMGLAFLTGLGVAVHTTRALGLPLDRVVGWVLGTFLSGLVGARLLFMAVQWRLFQSGRFHWASIWEGGIVFYGGLLGGLGFLIWVLRGETDKKRILEALAPALTLGHAVGRLGCYFNGCCHGVRCDLPWAVMYTDPHSAADLRGVPVHPTPLYESLGLVILGGLLLRNLRHARWGSNVRLYLVGYGILRFSLEFTRGDTLRGEWGPVSTSQLISIGVVAAGLILGRREAKTDPL